MRSFTVKFNDNTEERVTSEYCIFQDSGAVTFVNGKWRKKLVKAFNVNTWKTIYETSNN